MNVHLAPELEQLVQAKVQSGRYNSPAKWPDELSKAERQRDHVATARLPARR